MSDRTYTKADMPALEKDEAFQKLNQVRLKALLAAEQLRTQIEERFPAAEGWYWCQGAIDEELYLKKAEEQ